MENNEEKQPTRFGKLINKISDVSKKTTDSIQKSVKARAEKKQTDEYNRRMKKYNPLSKEDFESINLPNIIEIVDDAQNRGIDVFEGAIGWREYVNGTEVLFLHDEFVNDSGIQFVPVAKCDAVYCVDPFDRKRFIDASCIFEKTNDEKLAELENVAYMLGAKSCSIRIAQGTLQQQQTEAKTSLAKIGKAESVVTSGTSENSSGKIVSYFDGSDEPKRPELKWFAHYDNVNRLIEMRCSERNSIKLKVLELEGSSSATMSKSVACTIDKISKIKGKASAESKAVKECGSKLIFEIEF